MEIIATTQSLTYTWLSLIGGIVITALIVFFIKWSNLQTGTRTSRDKHAKFECPGCGELLQIFHNDPRWLEAFQRAKSLSATQIKGIMKRTGRCPICDRDMTEQSEEAEAPTPRRRTARRARSESSAKEILGLPAFAWILIAVGAGCVLLVGLVLVIVVVGAGSGPDLASQPPPNMQSPSPNTQPPRLNPKAAQQPPPNLQPAPTKPQPKETPPPPPAHEPPSATKLPGLLAYWSFDEGDGEKGVDASGRIIKAKLNNLSRVEGMRGRALSFKGAGSYFDYGDAPDLSFKAKAPFTIAFWVQTRLSRGTLLSHRNSRNGSPVIDILLSDGRTAAQVRCDGNEFAVPVQIDGKSVNDGNWHHVALTRDGDFIELFLDSVSQGRKSGAAAGGALTTNLRALGSERYWINHRPGPGDPHFQGSMDEFCIFGQALKAEEITSLAGR